MARKYFCLHGHFYQPPRENPWIEAIVRQPSARPYHDWNKRVDRECYAPNTRARLMDDRGRIRDLINNYEYMSFNFGPTLLIWLEKYDSWTYGQILAADRDSAKRLDGHGNAVAQVYNHLIMPLANPRDRLTQIRWGLADFAHRFGRPAKGIWLAETAADNDTLRDLAAEGVEFTILSPTQAQAVRPLEGGSWRDVSDGGIDITKPYRVLLDPKGDTYLDVFFYDKDLAKAVAFEQILATGDNLLQRIRSMYPDKGAGPFLVNVATDGESYGHHFKFGDMALGWVFDQLADSKDIQVVNYSWYLEHNPPKHRVRIKQPSSWSCAHGVERWRSDCGCSVSGNPAWNQAWRTPLRRGLDELRDAMAEIYEHEAAGIFPDPWAARDAYISVLLDPGPENRDRFLAEQAGRRLEGDERIKAWRLLESQRMALFMFTSCGWFFDDISNLEVRQVLYYAARGIELTAPWAGRDLEAGLLKLLAQAKSNLPEQGDGARVYEKRVKPTRMSPERIAANWALARLVDGPEPRALEEIVQPVEHLHLPAGEGQAVLGELIVHLGSEQLDLPLTYLAREPAGEGVSCLVGRRSETLSLADLAGSLTPALATGKEAEEVFASQVGDASRFVLDDLMADARSAFLGGLARRIYAEIRRTMGEQKAAVSILLSLAQDLEEPTAEFMEDLLPFYFAWELEQLIRPDDGERDLDWNQLRRLADMAEQKGLSVNQPALNRLALTFVNENLERLATDPSQTLINELSNMVAMINELHMHPDLWHCQNIYHRLSRDPAFTAGLDKSLTRSFAQLGSLLGFTSKEK